jgi:hypothetical protein
MTESKPPSEQPDSNQPDAGLRERVRERMRRMASMALLAATSLTNAACDPVSRSPPYGGRYRPTPTCEMIPSNWAQFMRAKAAWGTEAGEHILLLTISNPSDKPWLRAPTAYTVEGGMLLPSTARERNVLRIKPEPGATVIRLDGTMNCHVITAPMVITIDHLTDTTPTVEIDVG